MNTSVRIRTYVNNNIDNHLARRQEHFTSLQVSGVGDLEKARTLTTYNTLKERLSY